MIYLSHVLNNDTPTYGNKDLCIIEQTKKIANGDSSNNSQLHISSHVGTHIDTPYHFCKEGKTIDDYDPTFWFCNNPWLVDINNCESDLITFLSIKDKLMEIPATADILFFRSGFESFRNSDEQNKYIFDNPGIEAEIGYWLRENRSIKMIGLDFISLSGYSRREEGRLAHRAFLCPYKKDGTEHDPILIIEDMSLVRFEIKLNNVSVMPLRVKGGDGAPVTVVAW
jgi:kynurenine formamidase